MNSPEQSNKDLERRASSSGAFIDHPYQILIEKMAEAALILSKEGEILYCNPSFLRLMETSEPIIGTSFLDLIQENDRKYISDFLQQKKNNKTELSIVSKKQKTLKASISVSEILWNQSEERYLLLLNISETKAAHDLIEAIEAMARVLAMDIPLKVASQFMLEVFNSYFGWEVLIIWIWNHEKHKLQCAQISHIPVINLDSFEKKTREESSEKILLSAHISTSLRPMWIEDVSEDPNFLRRPEAIESGLRGAFAFPFLYSSLLGGVIELYRRTPIKEPVAGITLDAFASIGIMLGLYIQRIISDETRHQLSRILDHSTNNIYKVDLHGIITEWNFCAENNYGWRVSEIVGKSIDKIYPSMKSGKFYEILNDLLSEKPIEKFQSQRVKKNGEIFWVENSYEPLHNLFGEIAGVCAIEQDISFQKKLENDLVEASEKFQSYQDITQEWIFEIDRNGSICFSNQMVHKITGYTIEEILGKSFLYYIPIEERAKYEAMFSNYIEQRQGWLNLAVPCVYKDGTRRWLESSSIAILDANDHLIGFRGVNRDISKTKNLEKIKDEFVSVVNHELRTPLTSILGALTLLNEREMSPQDTKDLLETAQRNSLRLTKLIDDVMDVEKIQLGKLQYNFKKINLKDVVLESIHSSKIIADSFGIKIVPKEPFPDALVNGDDSRLLQVMTNLFSNAIKFSSNQGTIYISVEILNDLVRVSVEDFGPGIPKEFQPKIFEKFAQADSSPRRSFQGTGLGLSISKSIIERHRGTIQYKTVIGKGTTFFFEIPLYKEKI